MQESVKALNKTLIVYYLTSTLDKNQTLKDFQLLLSGPSCRITDVEILRSGSAKVERCRRSGSSLGCQVRAAYVQLSH